ncbi:MAG: sialate O-acetylesterase, partial [Candidatus Kapaibacterium sp.]
MKFTFYSILLAVSFVALSSIDSAAQIPTGASFWLRADSGVIFSQNNVVAEWKDQSGTTKSAFQSLPVSQPTLITSAFNTMPAIHFDGRFDYMDCAPIFPVSKDYTVSIVARVIDFSRSNNLLSGNTHAIYSEATGFSVVQNDTLPAPTAISKIPLFPNIPAIITIVYQQSTQTAKIYINGDLADSAFIGSNKDPKIYLGGFQGLASFYGDLAEIVLYSRALSETDRKQLEDYFFTKYAIIPTPAPDSIYTTIPKNLQFYARDNDDSATVPIAGNLFDSEYDSIYIKIFKDGTLTSRIAQPLHYESGKASFSFFLRIHAELSEYSFTLSEKNATVDKQIGRRDSIVCGDVLLISGQSNAIANNLGYTNEFFRTFGNNQASSNADTAWAISSTVKGFGIGPVAGSWGVRLQEDIMNTYHLPTCVINGGVGGTAIVTHLPDSLNRMNIGSFYGNMLYRTVKAGLAQKAKVFFWYQGESDILQGYADKFRILYNAWKQDYPNIRKIYVMQVRPGCSLGFSADVRNLLRTLQDSFPNIESVSTMGLPEHDGCHFDTLGYQQLGDQLFRLLGRDFYGSTDNDQISSPNIIQVYYTNSAHTRIGLIFTPSETRFIIPNDTVVGGIPASIKDY